jgi:hypothetical protein
VVLTTGGALAQRVEAAASATVTVSSYFYNPSVVGQSPVILDVVVQPNADGPPPTGTVTIYNDGNPVEQGTITYNFAENTSSYSVDIAGDIGLGDNYMTATYYGDTAYPVTGSNTDDQVVNQDSTTTTVSSSPNPSVAGQPVTFSSATTVVSPGAATPTGRVSFYIDNYSDPAWRPALDSSGHARLTVSDLTTGTHQVAAFYNGDQYCAGSFSASVNQSVTQAVPPVVASVTPRAGPVAGGTTLTISGSHFTSPATVRVGGVAATSVVVVSPTRISAKAPGHPSGTVDVQVTTAGGPSHLSSVDWFVYGAPTVTSLSPRSGSSAGGTAVTITGTGFANGETVRFGSAAATTVTVVSSRQLRVVAPATAAGTTVDVTVADAVGTSATNAADTYTYHTPPQVTAVSPRAGVVTGGTAITITGTNFTSPATVSIGGGAATSVVVVSATQITARSPAHPAGIVDVQVTTAGGPSSLSSADRYMYGPPAVTGLSVHSGPHTGGTVVTVTGTGFMAGDGVRFGGVAGTSVTIISPTQLTVTAPPGTAGATVDVTVTNPAGTSATSTADFFTYS